MSTVPGRMNQRDNGIRRFAKAPHKSHSSKVEQPLADVAAEPQITKAISTILSWLRSNQPSKGWRNSRSPCQPPDAPLMMRSRCWMTEGKSGESIRRITGSAAATASNPMRHETAGAPSRRGWDKADTIPRDVRPVISSKNRVESITGTRSDLKTPPTPSFESDRRTPVLYA